MKRHVVPVILGAIGVLVSLVIGLGTPPSIVQIQIRTWAEPLIVAGIVILGWYLVIWVRRKLKRAASRAAADAKAEARDAHRTLLGRLDHELKNPIAALQIALASVDDPVLAAGMGEKLNRLTSLVTELRKISEIDEYPLSNEPVDMQEVVSDVLDAAGLTTNDTDAGKLKVSVLFPKAPRPLPAVLGDRDLVFLALYNVVTNAEKYSDAGATLEIRALEDHGEAVIEISDTGYGIPASEVNNVWSELARGSAVRHIPGHGLGLPMVAAVMRRLHGSCQLSSLEGRGTTVRIRLPLI